MPTKEIHLIPECHDDDWHTTSNCWCRPARVDIRTGLFRSQHIVFHQEAKRHNEGNDE